MELPPGYKDPDELVRDDAPALAHAIEHARAEWQVLLDRSLADDEGGSVEQRRAAAERAAQVLRRIPEQATRDLYVQQVARRLDLRPEGLAADVARLAGEAVSQAAPSVVVALPETVERDGFEEAHIGNSVPTWERFAATLVLHQPGLAARFIGECGLSLSQLSHPVVRHVFELALESGDDQALGLHHLGEAEQAWCARLLISRPAELESDDALHRSMAATTTLIQEAPAATDLVGIRRELRRAQDEGRMDDVARLAEQLTRLAAASPHFRRSSR